MVESKYGIYGEFRLEVHRPDGTIREELDWQPNLITDAGLDAIGISQGFAYFCGVGSGNNPPAFNHDALQKQEAFVKYTEGYPAVASPRIIIDKPNNMLRRYNVFKYVFARGSLPNKNLSELGLATYYWDRANNRFDETRLYYTTRALIKDMSGNPTTISVRADEELYVFYRLWAIVPLFKKEVTLACPTKSGDVTTGTKNYKIVYEPNQKTNMSNPFDRPDTRLTDYGVALSENRITDGNWIGGVDPNVTGYYVDAQVSYNKVNTVAPYVMGSHEVIYNCVNKAASFHRGKNPAIGKAIWFGCTYIELIGNVYDVDDNTTGIPKNEEYEFIFSFKVKWDRYSGDTSIIKEN